jgi:hypothetical protein
MKVFKYLLIMFLPFTFSITSTRQRGMQASTSTKTLPRSPYARSNIRLDRNNIITNNQKTSRDYITLFVMLTKIKKCIYKKGYVRENI